MLADFTTITNVMPGATLRLWSTQIHLHGNQSSSPYKNQTPSTSQASPNLLKTWWKASSTPSLFGVDLDSHDTCCYQDAIASSPQEGRQWANNAKVVKRPVWKRTCSSNASVLSKFLLRSTGLELNISCHERITEFQMAICRKIIVEPEKHDFNTILFFHRVHLQILW